MRLRSMFTRQSMRTWREDARHHYDAEQNELCHFAWGEKRSGADGWWTMLCTHMCV